MLVTVVMLMISMSILHPALAIIASECAFWNLDDHGHADDSMCIIHSTLAIIGGELILACW